MAKAHPIELRERVVAHVEEGNTHRTTAAHFRVSIKFVNDMVKLKRETRSLDPKPLSDNRCHGKLEPHGAWIAQRIAAKSDITLDELRLELHRSFGITVHSTNVGRFLHRIGLSHKKRRVMPS